MRQFGNRHNDELEAELRALRSEPREEFVGGLSGTIGTPRWRRRTLRATASAVVAGATLVALGGLAFAGGGGGGGASSERNPRLALYPPPEKVLLCHFEAEGGGQGLHYVLLELPPAGAEAHLREHEDDVLAVNGECPQPPID